MRRSEDPEIVVFVSSTYSDMVDERARVMSRLEQFDEIRCIGMEQFGPDVESAFNKSLKEVDRADLFIILLGHRYGTGITENEYRRAIASKIDCLAYLKVLDESAEAALSEEAGENTRKLLCLRREVQDPYTGCLGGEFNNTYELESQITYGIQNWLRTVRSKSSNFLPISEHLAEIQRLIATDNVPEGCKRLLDFVVEYTDDQTAINQAILISQKSNRIHNKDERGGLDSEASIDRMHEAAGEALDLLISVSNSIGSEARQ